MADVTLRDSLRLTGLNRPAFKTVYENVYQPPPHDFNNPPVYHETSIKRRRQEEDLQRIIYYTENNSKFVDNQVRLYDIPIETRLPQSGDPDLLGLGGLLFGGGEPLAAGGLINTAKNLIDSILDLRGNSSFRDSGGGRALASFLGSSVYKDHYVRPRDIQNIMQSQTISAGDGLRFLGPLGRHNRYLPTGGFFRPEGGTANDPDAIGFESNLKNARVPIKERFAREKREHVHKDNKTVVPPTITRSYRTNKRNNKGPVHSNYGRRQDKGDLGNIDLGNISNLLGGAAIADKSDNVNTLEPHSDDNQYGTDFIKFRFKLIRDISPTSGQSDIILNFRAFLENFTDTSNANWTPHKYTGRAEDFYTYGGYSRSVSLGFMIATLTQAELVPIYKKLNHLKSATTPSYTNGFWMQSTILEIDVGDYLSKQPCLAQSIVLTLDKDTPWELGDFNTPQLPHMLKCDMTLNLIHRFAPQVSNNLNEPFPFIQTDPIPALPDLRGLPINLDLNNFTGLV